MGHSIFAMLTVEIDDHHQDMFIIKCHLIDFGLSMFLAETSMICSFNQFNPDWWLCFRCLILVFLKMDVSPF